VATVSYYLGLPGWKNLHYHCHTQHHPRSHQPEKGLEDGALAAACAADQAHLLAARNAEGDAPQHQWCVGPVPAHKDVQKSGESPGHEKYVRKDGQSPGQICRATVKPDRCGAVRGW